MSNTENKEQVIAKLMEQSKDSDLLSLDCIVDNYSIFAVFLDDRFANRIYDFLSDEQIEKLDFIPRSESNREKIDYTLENIVKKLVGSADFGKEKAEDERGISSSLMYETVRSLLLVVKDVEMFEQFNDSNYDNYGIDLFNAVLEKYGD